jgi:hypothetical protein
MDIVTRDQRGIHDTQVDALHRQSAAVVLQQQQVRSPLVLVLDSLTLKRLVPIVIAHPTD